MGINAIQAAKTVIRGPEYQVNVGQALNSAGQGDECLLWFANGLCGLDPGQGLKLF